MVSSEVNNIFRQQNQTARRVNDDFRSRFDKMADSGDVNYFRYRPTTLTINDDQTRWPTIVYYHCYKPYTAITAIRLLDPFTSTAVRQLN